MVHTAATAAAAVAVAIGLALAEEEHEFVEGEEYRFFEDGVASES